MIVEQLLEGLHHRDGHLNSLHSLLYLHLEKFFGYKVGKSLDTNSQLSSGPYAKKQKHRQKLSIPLSQLTSSTNTYFVNDQIAELLQKDHHALWSAVMVGVTPDETQCVEKSWQERVHLWKAPLF